MLQHKYNEKKTEATLKQNSTTYTLTVRLHWSTSCLNVMRGLNSDDFFLSKSRFLGDEVAFASTYLRLVDLEFDGDLEREEQLVLFEDARAAVVVHVQRVRVGDVA